jgi:hypothetical protein
MPLLWEMLEDYEKDALRHIMPDEWKPSENHEHPVHLVVQIEGTEAIARIMKEKPKGKQGVLKG